MISLKAYEVWFITGSQHLYGEETLKQVARHAEEIAKALNDARQIPVKVVFKPVLVSPDGIYQLVQDANHAPNCIGLVAWMHTFSPAKMWIAGLKILQKPLAHLHTQYNRDIPWSAIDMDFMNLNQSAHGGREFGFIGSRMKINRKVIVGHWQDEAVQDQLAIWTRSAAGWADSQKMKVARFGDNMREVAVTEGNKVSAQIQFGYAVNGYGIGDLVARVQEATDQQIDQLVQEYQDSYQLADSLTKGGEQHASLREAARIELGMRAFLEDGNFTAFTDTFENLYGLEQLPGLAVQRLMADGYGFGGEGDWKTAALVRTMKVMGSGLEGGNSFMEDYTYHFHPGKMQVLGSHMLEICPSIAAGKPSCEIHPLGIGGKADPVRLVFNAPAGPALNASVVDMGHRFRLLVNTVDAVEPEQDLPKLPVARVLWEAQPDLKTAATAWILAGGAHHTCFSQSLNTEYLENFAEMAGIEFLLIDNDTSLYRFKQELRWNEACY
ncbi:L-arabinose isomerase [Flavilitoribacter nigricans]|uniref:L-arabinose isomerase n=1 Tax=Flavilitoribacter nigricans (strain ATCC 23147 / DSM 23189 / NBRC 102662 / NCIMB 1420 / SS-2) TaxID=1122177 RepID=A0A2D0NJT8_FLAN2|nr:L-arabinose isomerase [Flavilitoribacter nigricans]PHN08698.1 L-arabinose isomerase [Flavilitoribacter nigricans DSM 23189 = NBRC 102662]